ncbi:DNA-binding protein [Mannheimia haemolytica]|uniref:DNA-binding protein n=1 Tax=Mannheimia haemolytica TaxID=75985 RepID=UPI0033598A93
MGNLPEQPSNVTRRATKNNWLKKTNRGKKGVAFEYHYSSLPISVQQELGFAQTAVKEEPRTLVAAQTADEMERVPFYNVQASSRLWCFQ